MEDIIKKRNELRKFIVTQDKLKQDSPNHVIDMNKYKDAKKNIQKYNKQINEFNLNKNLSTNPISNQNPNSIPKNIETNNDINNRIRIVKKNQRLHENFIKNQTQIINRNQEDIIEKINTLINIQNQNNINQEIKEANKIRLKNISEYYLNLIKIIENKKKMLESLQNKILKSIESRNVHSIKDSKDNYLNFYDEFKNFLLKEKLHLNNELNKLIQDIDFVKQLQIQEKNDEINKLIRDIDFVKHSQIQEKNDEINKLNQEKNDEINKLNQEKNDEINKLIQEKNDEINKLNQDIDFVKESQIQEKNDEINKLNQEKNDEINKLNQEKNDEINKLIQEKNDEINKLIQDIDFVKQSQIQEKNDEINKLIQEKNDEINKLNQDIDFVKQSQIKEIIYECTDEIIEEEQPKILIVMPTYNRSEYIEKSIKMINIQSHNNWVFLIIDDGSSENHKNKFREIKKKYESDKIIFQENKVNCHIAKTLNKGIEYLFNSKTNFTHFTWISDDNQYYPNFLKELSDENTFFKYGAYNIQELNLKINTNKKQYKDFDDLLNHFVGCASFMWTKEAIEEIGFYDESIPGCEDYEYLLRTFKLNLESCNYTHIPTMKYIRHEESLMEQNREAIMNMKNDIIRKYTVNSIKSFSSVEDIQMNLSNPSKYMVDNWKYKISIVMGYYNRKPQTLETLKGFERMYAGKYSFEVIIVDDNSNDENKLEEDIKQFTFPINLIVISEEEKGDRVNPCVTYNRGFAETKGEIVIIQNPECYHVGDIISYTINNLKEQDYFTFSCFTANTLEITNKMLKSDNIFNLINDNTFLQKNMNDSGIYTCWYNHPTYNNYNTCYHFTSAIFKSKLDLIDGFDKEFSNGYCYDDDDFLLSIKYNLKLNIHIIEPKKCFVIHQYHYKSNITESDVKFIRNKQLYENKTKIHLNNNFEYPKLLFLYWDGSPLSYLNYLTVISFNTYNPGWKIIVFIPEIKTETISWVTHEQKLKYDQKCYFTKLYSINNLTIKKINLDEIGFYNSASEVIKSDYLRYYCLYKHGGLWSDFDIIYTSSIERKMNFNETNIIFKCISYGDPKNKNINEGYAYFPIGFFLSKPNSKLFNYICSKCKNIYDPNEYQSIGAVMWGSLFKNDNDIYAVDKNIKICDYEYYLPWAWNELDEFLEKYDNNLPPNNVGIHWFNGATKSKEYAIGLEKRLNENLLVDKKCYLDSFINKYSNTKKVSIVMAYFNKKKQLIQTLESIKKSSYKNIEIIIVDDNSEESERVVTFIENIKSELEIKVITIEEDEKTWVNPCVPYNIGIAQATGEIIIIQNPEVMHVGDCIDFIVKNLEINDWMTFNCYGSTGYNFNEILEKQNNNYEEIYEIINNIQKKGQEIYDLTPIHERYKYTSCNSDLLLKDEFFLIGGNSVLRDDVGGWLNHYKGHFVAYHYLAAIHKKDLVEKMNGGFNEIFKNGIGGDDDEFVKRLILNKFNFKITRFEKKYPFSIHLFHEKPSQLKIDSKYKFNNNFDLLCEFCKKNGLTPIADIHDKTVSKDEIPISRIKLIQD